MRYDSNFYPELCVVKDEVRPHLCVVSLDTTEASPVLVATNGHMLCVVPCSIDAGDTAGPVSVAALQGARKLAKAARIAEVNLSVSTTHTLSDGISIPRRDVGQFPPWRGLVPGERQEVSITLNPKLLAQLAKAIGSQERVTIRFVNDAYDPILVKNPESEAFGILMSMRRPE